MVYLKEVLKEQLDVIDLSGRGHLAHMTSRVTRKCCLFVVGTGSFSQKAALPLHPLMFPNYWRLLSGMDLSEPL